MFVLQWVQMGEGTNLLVLDSRSPVLCRSCRTPKMKERPELSNILIFARFHVLDQLGEENFTSNLKAIGTLEEMSLF